jgi:hypothetical protein
MKNKLLLALGLITLGVVSRLVPHPPNLTAIGAVSIIAGVYLPRKFALAVPLLAMLLADSIVGFHSTIAWVYGSFALIVILGAYFKNSFKGERIIAFPLASALLFYAVSNFGVWVAGGLYPLTLSGLLDSYIRALPFLKPTLAGDLLYTVLIYASLELVKDLRWRDLNSFSISV